VRGFRCHAVKHNDGRIADTQKRVRFISCCRTDAILEPPSRSQACLTMVCSKIVRRYSVNWSFSIWLWACELRASVVPVAPPDMTLRARTENSLGYGTLQAEHAPTARRSPAVTKDLVAPSERHLMKIATLTLVLSAKKQ
jgi:hypothetical protein